jgi:hypothetical protein
MLTEIRETRQIPGEGYRRWFTDERMDLIVWYTHEKGKIIGFQLCYDKEEDEKALTWTRESGFTHERVDDGGDRGYSHKGTPLLLPDGEFRSDRVLRDFTLLAEEIEEPLRRFVGEVLKRYR